MTADFQRARSPEQQARRRAAIVATARALLDEAPLTEISLRDLGRAVGLSKSNVVRYFPTREAVYLTVLVEEWDLWLADLGGRLADPSGERRLEARAVELAEALTGSLVAHPRFCDLLAACQSVLERNVPVPTAREFKTAALGMLGRLAAEVRGRVPEIGEAGAFEFAGALWVLVAGAWPLSRPTPAVATVLAEPGLAALSVDFERSVGRVLADLLVGMAARGR